MVDVKPTVGSVMVNSPVVVEDWHPVAHARQLMLMHSFSFLPVRLEEKWFLVSELGLARFLNVGREQKVARLGLTIAEAVKSGFEPVPIAKRQLLTTDTPLRAVLDGARVQDGPMLWLVVDGSRPDRLAGVLSPFELM
jgi:CBS-domain-containing membrane protein